MRGTDGDVWHDRPGRPVKPAQQNECSPSLSLTTKNWRITLVNANKTQTVNACKHVQADDHYYTYSLNTSNNNHSRDESTRNLANILSFKFESHETRVTRIRHATPRNFM